MKKLFILWLLLISFALTAKSQTKILSKDALSYVGKEVIICDSVYESRTFSTLTLLNLGGGYPKQNLTIVINNSDITKSDGNPSKIYINKNICVYGKIELFKNKPQIVIKQPKNINIL